MKHRIIILVALILSILFIHSLCVFSDSDFIIPVKEGSFVLKNINVDRYDVGKLHVEGEVLVVGKFYVRGDILNNTNKDWQWVQFDVNLYGDNDRKLEGVYGNTIFTIRDIKKYETKSIGKRYDPHGETLFVKDKGGKLSRYEISYYAGEYAAQYRFIMTKPKFNKNLNYQDNDINISFKITRKQLAFVLRNKTENPVNIIWDQLSYIDVLKKTHKVMHSGVNYTDREKHQTPSVVPPTAEIDDNISPIDHVFYVPEEHGGWGEEPILPELPEAKAFKGKTFSIFMSMEINGKIKNYFFSFKIENV